MDQYRIDSHKLYWHMDRLAQWQAGKSIVPIYVEISPVGFCNHKCIFCGIDFAMRKKAQLETRVLCNRLKEMGASGVRSVMFAGEGEPLLHKDLPKLIRTAKDAGIDVSMTTNGSAGRCELWKEILPRLTWIRFSVDAATPETYSRVHGVAQSVFDRTVSAIEEAVAVKKNRALDVTIGVQFLIVDKNIGDIEKAIKLFSGLGVDYISLKPYSLHPRMIAKKDMCYSAETVKMIEDIIIRHKKRSGASIIFRKDAMGKYIDKDRKFHHCRALPFWGYISSEGDFYTCSVFIGDKRFRAGNIYKENMDDIIFGARRERSIAHAEKKLNISGECRLNCRMARINEFLESLQDRPEHINFI